MKFQPILAGNFGALSVNRRFRELYQRVEALEALLGKQEVHSEPETVTENSAATVVVEQFDWNTCEDAQQLKDFALDSLGLTIKGNKKAETIRDEIRGFLESQGV